MFPMPCGFGLPGFVVAELDSNQALKAFHTYDKRLHVHWVGLVVRAGHLRVAPHRFQRNSEPAESPSCAAAYPFENSNQAADCGVKEEISIAGFKRDRHSCDSMTSMSWSRE